MQLNKVLKSLAIVLPMMTLAACSSTDNADSSAANQNGTNGGGTSPDQTIVTPVDPSGSMSEEQLHEQQLQQLRQEQTIFFKFDNSEIQPEYQAVLEAHAAYLRDHPSIKVIVEGHADERGTPEYNIALGERRATAVAQYLQALGVPASQLSIVSYGEEKPLVLGHTDADYAKNRRAVLVY